jgi:hypothetical protein
MLSTVSIIEPILVLLFQFQIFTAQYSSSSRIFEFTHRKRVTTSTLIQKKTLGAQICAAGLKYEDSVGSQILEASFQVPEASHLSNKESKNFSNLKVDIIVEKGGVSSLITVLTHLRNSE